jgi:hypothetical protein
MTPEAQRIAIAEACGWTEVRADPEHYIHSGLRNPHKLCGRRNGRYWALPDHLSDLNAMHEAEKVLTATQIKDYVKSLLRIHCRDVKQALSERLLETDVATLHVNTLHALIHATAAQRAEAFLRTLNLWKD